jgi:hypothetical protein
MQSSHRHLHVGSMSAVRACVRPGPLYFCVANLAPLALRRGEKHVTWETATTRSGCSARLRLREHHPGRRVPVRGPLEGADQEATGRPLHPLPINLDFGFAEVELVGPHDEEVYMVRFTRRTSDGIYPLTPSLVAR